MSNFLEIEESDIDLGINLSDYDEEPEISEFEKSLITKPLQGTPEWHKDRHAQWTASEIKKLMTCSSKYSKVTWHNPEKFLGFSDGSIKYIYKKAKERETGRVLSSRPTQDMKYGTAIEELTFKRADIELRKQGLYLEKVGYKKFDEIPTAGASSDAIVRSLKDHSIVGSAEMKACCSWETMFDRTFEATDETSMDFWQTQQQMLAWNVDKTYYVVISPPSDTYKYINSENVLDLFDMWCEETEMNFEIIDKSDIHCSNLLKRIKIAEETIGLYIESKENIKEILYSVISNHSQTVKVETLPAPETPANEEIDSPESAIDEVMEQKENEAPAAPEKQIDSLEELDEDLPF